MRFILKDIRIVGAKALPAAGFRKLYEKLLGKEVGLADILDIADAIEQAYREAGYLLVRAYVPPQRVRDGIFTINITEGHVAHVSVQGGFPATVDQVTAYLKSDIGVTPPNVSHIERELLLANDLPGVTASGVLRPALDTPGASDIVVDIDQPRMSGGMAVDNRGSHFSGLWTVTGDVQINSLFGADQLSAALTTSPDASEHLAGELRYRDAIGEDGALASLVVSAEHGEPGSTLTAFNILNVGWAAGPRLSYPIIRSRAETLALEGGFTVQDAHVNILGTHVSHDQWRVFDLAVTWLRSNSLGGSWSSTVDLAQGLPILGATPDDSAELSRKGGSTDFTKVTGLAFYIQPLWSDFSVALAGQGQYSFSPLITGELISFGGSQIVGRGYDPGSINGDQGLGGSVELRYDKRLDNSILLAIEPYAYFDAGRTYYIQDGASMDASLVDQTIASVGGGMRSTLAYNANLGLEVSQTLRAVPGSDAGRRATKILVNASMRF